jgi:Flp pilus assembly protein TadG
MCTMIKQRLSGLIGSDSGGIAVTTAILLMVFLGLASLAFDIGHVAMVKSELRRTADAAALAGAMGLAPYTGSVTNPTPNWTQGETKAHEVIAKAANLADGQAFTTADGIVTHGYWLLNPPAGSTQTLPSARPTTAAYVPEPGVRVTLNRTVTMFLAPLVGAASTQVVSATATAIIVEAYSIRKLPPIAVSEDTVYNNVNGNIVMDISDQDIKVQSNKGDAGWFNLDGGNSVPSVLFSDPLTAAETPIYLVPGTKATLTDLVSAGQTIILPVVDAVDQKVWKTISGFAGFYVEEIGANDIKGHFVTKVFNPFVNPTPYNSTNSPVWSTPRLVQ